MDEPRSPDHPPRRPPAPDDLPADFKPIQLPERGQADNQWLAHKRRASAPYRAAKPSKHVYFDGPHGDEIRAHIEAVATLKGWSISDTILYYLRRGIARESDK